MSLKKYLSESELAAVQPVTGDEFDISLREITNIETVVVEHTDGAIMIELDDAAIAMLREHGVELEEDEQLDEIWPVLGAIGRAALPLAGRALGGALAGTGALAGGALSGAGSLAGGALSGLGSLVGGAAQGIKNATDDDSNESVSEYDDDEYLPQEGDVVRIDHASEHEGQLGQVVELAPSGKFAYVEFKDGAIESYDASSLEKVSDDEADAYLDQEEIDELAPLKALAGLGSKMVKSAPSKAAGRIIKSAGKAVDKKMFGPRPHEEDYEESINGVRRLAGMATKEAKTTGYDKTSGSPYDRGSADAYYGRPARPHKMAPAAGGVQGQMERVSLADPAEIAAYNAGYSEEDDRKDYGESVEQIVSNIISENKLSDFLPPFTANGLYVSDRRGDTVLEVTRHGSVAKEIANALNKHVSAKESQVNEISQDAAVDLIDRARKMFPDNSHPVHKSIAGLIQAINVGSAADDRYAAEIRQHLGNVKEGRFEEPVSGYRIVNKKTGQAHPGKFASKDAAQKHLMTKMFANHQDYEVKSFDESVNEAEYRGRKVALGKPMQGDVKKFKVYVKDPSTGNVKKVNFGDPNMRIKKSNPARRKSFRARHNCANPGPRTKARYWSCRKW